MFLQSPESLSLTKLTVDCNMSPKMLSLLVVRLREVDAFFIRSSAQSSAVCRSIIHCQSLELRKLTSRTWDLISRPGWVPAETLAKAVIRLEEVTISGPRLSPVQASALFTAIRDSTEDRLRSH